MLPGGFPYEDRIGFGVVPAKIVQFALALRTLVDKGKPVLAFCAGDQIAQYMRLAFPQESQHNARMLTNIGDKNGELVYSGFIDARPYLKLICAPERTAFTRSFEPGEVMQSIIDHGGGRFTADSATLRYLLDNGLIVTRYCDKEGNIIDNFPTNPNGSLLNIESVTNVRGNVKLGMAHNERKLHALEQSRDNLVFASMREYIEDRCPDLSANAQRQQIPLTLKDYSYLSRPLDPAKTIDLYIRMLTDDNERTTAQLFLEGKVELDRRRLLRVELYNVPTDERVVQLVVQEIARMDMLDGIMLKKDLPTIVAPGLRTTRYEVVGKDRGTLIRSFVPQDTIIAGFPVMHQEVPLPNPVGYTLRAALWNNPNLAQLVKNVHVGRAWFFPDEAAKRIALEKLLR